MKQLIEKALDLGWEVVEPFRDNEYELNKYSPLGTWYSFNITASDKKEFVEAVKDELLSFEVEHYVEHMLDLIDNGLDCDMSEAELEKDGRDILDMIRELYVALNNVCNVEQKYLTVLEKLDWDYYIDTNDNSVELEKQSPAGEDFIFSVSIDNFVDDVIEYSAYFDQEEHVRDLVDASRNGFAGVPGIKELVEDAKAIDDMLRELACALQDARLGKPEPKPKKKWRIPVKWTVESIAEVEADSLNEAMDILASRSELEFSIPEEENVVDAGFNTDIDEVRELFNGGQEDD